MTEEEKIICKEFLNDADKTHSCNEYKLLMALLEQEPILDKIREEIKVMTSNRGFLSCSVGHIHEEIDNVFDKYKAETVVEDGNN